MTVRIAPAVATARRGRRRLVHALLVLAGGHRVGDDAGAGLHVGHPVGDDRGADRDGHVEVAVEVEVAHHAAVDAAPGRLVLLDEGERRGLGAPESVPAGKVDTSTS